ncbi:nitrogenase component 1 [Methanocella arvoryzae]|uniref:Nitrogenase molybdenum-iron cofactor biosynthesis protein n=1 Tax=Methanocella arvoryzae (strain DSM 22066 / NBRC 105507 / MRE50) TaxID=351160 RepID=Q0W437_METAR|nr:nitrogenase component 1 [Methanocella arvoryzae]CAJ36856.1 nitrogenase molybdenum-iron cofactor biosynthesis protein [Methanocella arvoryzae MRE50]
MTDKVRMVNENQCQTCMPLGGVIAFKGVEGAMALVHGSQGCSTYMRLASVEHYNEPIDIASSSLNEKQTIHGGEGNLRKALDNVLRIYQPAVLGVVTTCLTETIGEDIQRMIKGYVDQRSIVDQRSVVERGLKGVDIIPVNTPSYAGSQSEGFWAAVRAIVEYFARPAEKHGGINVIVPHISPADIREIKRILDLAGIEYTLLPDYSMTLDRPYGGQYTRIAPGGTRTADIARMAGARATIQFGLTCPEELSPGRYLQQEYGVPLINLPLPIGLENTDRFVETLSQLTGMPLPETLVVERGWLLDAMADTHKYNAEGRPVIYGEPELVYAFASVCAENGAYPAVVATGTRSSRLTARLKLLLAEADRQCVLLEETDFTAIESAAVSTAANIAVGHSGGKFLTERRGIPVVRMGFPIHDRIGGQRILSAGYAGTLAFLDRFTNALLEQKYASYRQLKREQLLDPISIEGDQ